MTTNFSFQNVQPHVMQMLALAQAEGLKVFQYEDDFYIGETQDIFDQKEKSLCNDPDLENREDVDTVLKQWIEDKGFLLLEDEFEISSYDNKVVEYAGGEYLVVTESRANDIWEERLDDYLEQCVYPELSGNLAQYFDDEEWKRDARRDGRGHAISGYDGNEYNATIDGESFCIFRIN
jgi:hypothetical protein